MLDLSRVLAGPWSTQILADLGADVVKVETPGRGDDTRAWGPPFLKGADGEDEIGTSAYYLAANRNKRSIAVDFADPAGAACSAPSTPPSPDPEPACRPAGAPGRRACPGRSRARTSRPIRSPPQ